MSSDTGIFETTWSYQNPVKVVAGAGIISRLPSLTPEGRLLLVTSSGFVKRGVVHRIQEIGSDQGRRLSLIDSIAPNPDVDHLDDLIREHSGEGFGAIVALGGGSVLDSAKVLGACLDGNAQRPLHQHFRKGFPLDVGKAIPVIAVPTTAGTGAEVTPFATVWDYECRRKYSLAGDFVYPCMALLDPLLTLSLPQMETLHTGLDALSHALESLWNKNTTPLSEIYAVHSIEEICNHFPVVMKDPCNIRARTQMQLAAMLSGCAISQTRTAIAHAISYPLTLNCGIPHGLACGFTLPAILDRQLRLTSLPDRYRNIFMQARQLLECLDLPTRIHQYASCHEVCDLANQMMHPGRFDNYTEDMDIDTLRHILFTAQHE